MHSIEAKLQILAANFLLMTCKTGCQKFEMLSRIQATKYQCNWRLAGTEAETDNTF